MITSSPDSSARSVFVKRRYDEDEEEQQEQPNKKQRDSQFIVEAAIIDDFGYAVQNVVWMNENDMNDLFSDVPKRSINTDKRKYVHLANRVYRVGITHGLPWRTIGLTSMQAAAMRTSSFVQDMNPKYWIRPCRDKEFPFLGSAEFEISHFRPESRSVSETDVLHLEELKKSVSTAFVNHMINYGQELLFRHNQEQYILKVDDMTPVNQSRFQKYGYVGASTNFTFRVKENSKIAMVDLLIKKQAAKFIFSVDLSKAYYTEHFPDLPFTMDIERLQDTTLAQLGSKTIVIGQEFKIFAALDCTLFLTLKTVELEGQIFDASWIHSKLRPMSGFQALNKQQIKFNTNSRQVLLTKKENHKAKAIDIEINFIGYVPGIGSPYEKLHWIDISALKKQIIENNKTLCNKQSLFHDIGKKRFYFKVIKGYPIEPFAHERKSGKVHWDITPETDLRFCVANQVKIPPVDSVSPRSVKEAVFKILPADRKMPKVNVTEEEVINAIRKVVTEPFISNQVFDISLSSTRIKVSIIDFSIEKTLGPKPIYGTLGKLSEITKIKLDNANKDLVVQNTKSLLDMDPVQVLKEKKLGGITKEFQEIYSTVIIQRALKDDFMVLDIPMDKGLLLYGEPGNGKTKVAQVIAEMLGCTLNNGRLIMRSGTDIFIKWVGDSEAAVRALFKPALDAYEQFHDESELYVIVIDEIDGMLKKRKDRDGGSNVSENVVNQFLTCLDGLKKLPNVLVIGMTNRKDLIDEAALRFGRLGKHSEFKKPDLKGRQEIFEVHADIMKKIPCLAADVDFAQLAKETEDFSGADITGVVTEAFTARCKRVLRLNLPSEEKAKHVDFFISMNDFRKPIEEVKQKKKSADKGPPEGMYQ